MSRVLKLYSKHSRYVYQKSSLLTSFSIFYYTKKLPSLLICTKYSKIHCPLLMTFFQNCIIALIEILIKGNNHVYKIKTDFYRSISQVLNWMREETAGKNAGICHLVKRRSVFYCQWTWASSPHPQFIISKAWQHILHNQMSLKLKYALRWHQDVVIASYSYHLKE